MPYEADWVAHSIAAKLDRMRAANDVTHEMLRRSRAQLTVSYELLRIEVPNTWRTARGRSGLFCNSESGPNFRA
jgi:hypothetical protein